MDTTEPTFEIKYRLSEKYIESQVVETGERPEEKQTLQLKASELSEEARKKLVEASRDCSSSSGKADYRLSLDLPNLKVTSKRVGRKKPGGISNVRLEDWPSLSDGIGLGTSDHYYLDEPLDASSVTGTIDAWKEREEEIREDYHEKMEETLDRLIDLQRENLGEVGENRSVSPLILRAKVVNQFEGYEGYEELVRLRDEAEKTREKIEERQEQRKQKRKEEKRRKKERFEEEKREWAEAHGSRRFRKGIEEGYDCTRLYFQERVDVEYPDGFYVDFDKEAEYEERTSPSMEALKLADEVDGEVVWLTQPGSVDPETDRGYGFEPKEAVVAKGPKDSQRTYDIIFEMK